VKAMEDRWGVSAAAPAAGLTALRRDTKIRQGGHLRGRRRPPAGCGNGAVNPGRDRCRAYPGPARGQADR
ncbi:MAG: hypothetical protein ACE5JR_10710, partial [Gemmatimonadota bacterium]